MKGQETHDITAQRLPAEIKLEMLWLHRAAVSRWRCESIQEKTLQSVGSELDDVCRLLFSLWPEHLYNYLNFQEAEDRNTGGLKKDVLLSAVFRHKVLGSAVKTDPVRWCRGSAVRLKPVSKAKWTFRPTAAFLRLRAGGGGEDGKLCLDTRQKTDRRGNMLQIKSCAHWRLSVSHVQGTKKEIWVQSFHLSCFRVFRWIMKYDMKMMH